MGNVQSSPVAQCIQGPELAKRVQLLEEQHQTLLEENEKLRKELRNKTTQELAEELSAKTGGASIPIIRRHGSLVYGNQKFSKRTDDDNTLTSAAAIVASAEATANYQRSLVHVSVKNAPDADFTLVAVRAPNRRLLLGDMSGALNGLGLTVKAAGIEAESASAETAVLRFSLLEDGQRISDPARLELIEQRLQHASTGREGLAGGVKRLVVPLAVRASPPWPHEPLEYERPSKPSEQVWLETLRAALGPSSEAAFGAFSCANAKRLAVDLLPEMQRFLIPPGVEIS